MPQLILKEELIKQQRRLFHNLGKIFIFKNHKKKEENKFYKNFFAATLGSSTMHISAFIDTWLASMLISGSISYL